MEANINVIKRDPKIQNNINIMLDRYMSVPYDFQSKIRHNRLLQNVILKELFNIMSTTITDLDRELKIKISRIKYLENKLL